MKKLLVIAAVTLASTSAFATKARMAALSNSAQLVDTQTIFINPADLTLMGSWATFEMGATNPSLTPTSSPNAEAGFARAMGDARWGFYMGHTTVASTLREAANAGVFLSEENPINLFYAAKTADMAWGLGLGYSNSDRKAAGKQSSMGLNAGMRMGAWDAALVLGLTDTAEVGTDEWKGKSNVDLRGGYTMESWYFYGKYAMGGGKYTAATVTAADLDASTIEVGAINSTKVEGGEFFYGVAYQMNKDEDKTAATKTEETVLPVTVGIEADAASWLTLRGSITQPVLLGSVKSTPGDTVTVANDTTVAAGAGIKFNKFTLDATLAGSTTGTINGNSLLANAGLTYNF
ncbi:hypothetical protein [Bdellovibrio sp. HCB337]|uniref:hypothetical protein n=1 Tax=Bdellovibrio sp. HCB337 TaxID=3394358 RepID=UPI0039A6F548